MISKPKTNLCSCREPHRPINKDGMQEKLVKSFSKLKFRQTFDVILIVSKIFSTDSSNRSKLPTFPDAHDYLNWKGQDMYAYLKEEIQDDPKEK